MRASTGLSLAVVPALIVLALAKDPVGAALAFAAVAASTTAVIKLLGRRHDRALLAIVAEAASKSSRARPIPSARTIRRWRSSPPTSSACS
jgi:hypothetical protein